MKHFSTTLRLVLPALLLCSLPAHALELKGRLEWQHKVDMRVVENGVVEEVNVTTGTSTKAIYWFAWISASKKPRCWKPKRG